MDFSIGGWFKLYRYCTVCRAECSNTSHLRLTRLLHRCVVHLWGADTFISFEDEIKCTRDRRRLLSMILALHYVLITAKERIRGFHVARPILDYDIHNGITDLANACWHDYWDLGSFARSRALRWEMTQPAQRIFPSLMDVAARAIKMNELQSLLAFEFCVFDLLVVRACGPAIGTHRSSWR